MPTRCLSEGLPGAQYCLKMRLHSALVLPITLLALTQLALVGCNGGGSGADADIAALVQTGDYSGAISAAEAQLPGVEQGSEAHKDLILNYTAALAESDAKKARDQFLSFAKAHEGLVGPSDYKYVVSQLRTYESFIEAIDVMDAGKKRWPEDTSLDQMVAALKQDIETSGDTAAAAKMKGLGYM